MKSTDRVSAGVPEWLSRYAVFVLDVDGVLVRGSQPVPGAAEALAALRRHGRIVLLTNNSTRSRRATAAGLAELGFFVSAEETVTSSYVAARYLQEEAGRCRAWPLGEEGLHEELAAAGHRISEPREADWIVVGMDRKLTYDKLARALEGLLRGARLLATNRDGTFPTPAGLQPGAGAVVGALEGMGFAPEEVVGKPSPIAFQVALEVAGAGPEEALMIGDRLETDILGAAAVGMDTAMVLTGVSTGEAAKESGAGPTWVAADLGALARGEVIPG
ncbi:MAG: HAD-IIA family hydrolase [Candidatus Bipolaricaulaceae bacterium]